MQRMVGILRMMSTESHGSSASLEDYKIGRGGGLPEVISCDVVVVGGGHAGCEAAAAAARAGADTILLTQRLDTVGEMACNPAIGGVGKGTLVREIDALGGLMGQVADDSGIQFRVLNRSRGPAVHGPRCQSDRDLYKRSMATRLCDLANRTRRLRFVEDGAEDLVLEGVDHDRWKVNGLKTSSGATVRASCVVITTGTFLRGTVHLGPENYPAGRHVRDGDDVEPGR